MRNSSSWVNSDRHKICTTMKKRSNPRMTVTIESPTGSQPLTSVINFRNIEDDDDEGDNWSDISSLL